MIEYYSIKNNINFRIDEKVVISMLGQYDGKNE